MRAKSHTADPLARSFIALLRQQAAREREDPSVSGDALAEFMDFPGERPARVESAPRPDLVAAAVMLARGLATAEGVLHALATANPVVVIEVPASDWVGPVQHAVEACAIQPTPKVSKGRFSRASAISRESLVIGRNGSSTSHRPDKGNDIVGDAVQAGHPIVGIAPDARRMLPSDLMRAAEHRLRLPTLDASAIALVIETVTGTRPTRDPDARLAAACDLSDLRLAIHASRGADGSLDRLEAILGRRGASIGAGPGVEELVGYGEARAWGLALVDDLRRWRAGEIRFSDCSSALLLSGPPGCGKTQFALALARSTGLPLRSGSLGQWQAHKDGHLGHTLGAMRQFFEAARSEPCIALIDEIDSFGDRNSFTAHHRDYSTQIVNSLLEHLDGAVAREGVVVIGATNHPDRIDAAIRRSGRLDRHVRIGLPGIDDLAGILRRYLAGDLAEADLRPLAVRARGMTGADVEAVVRRARGHARRRPDPALAMEDLDVAMAEDRPAVGGAVRLRASVHEAGHGLASVSGGMARSVVLSVQATGGLTEAVPFDDGGGTEAEIEDRLVMLLAGRAAEQVLLGDVSAGAVGDLAMATHYACLMETRWGFSREYPLVSLCGADEVSVARMPWLMRPIQDRLAVAYERALDLVRGERPALERLAEGLFRAGYLEDREVRALIAGSDGASPPSAGLSRLRETAPSAAG